MAPTRYCYGFTNAQAARGVASVSTSSPSLGSWPFSSICRLRLVFVIAPGVALQSACGKRDRRLFVHALRKGLCGFLPKHDIEEGGLFLPFFVAIAIGAIDGESARAGVQHRFQRTGNRDFGLGDR